MILIEDVVLFIEAAPTGGRGPVKQSFAFDRVLGADEGQSSVYDSIDPWASFTNLYIHRRANENLPIALPTDFLKDIM